MGVGAVPRRKDSLQIGEGAPRDGPHNISIGGEGNPRLLQQGGVGVEAQRQEKPLDGQGGKGTVRNPLEHQPGHVPLPVLLGLLDAAVEMEAKGGMALQPLLEELRPLQFAAGHNHMEALHYPAEVEGLVQGGTPIPGQGDGFAPVEGTVTGGAEGDVPSLEAPPVLRLAVARPRGQDDRLRLEDGAVVQGDGFDGGVQLEFLGHLEEEFRPQPLRLLHHGVGEVEAGDGFGKAGVVFDFRGLGKQAARQGACQHDGMEARPGGVDGGGASGGAGAQDDKLFHGKAQGERWRV